MDKTAQRSMGPIDWLQIMFIGFKLAGVGEVADWSWWWVLSPLWIFLCLLFLIAVAQKLAE